MPSFADQRRAVKQAMLDLGKISKDTKDSDALEQITEQLAALTSTLDTINHLEAIYRAIEFAVASTEVM